MSTRTPKRKIYWLWLALVAWPLSGVAQVPVDESGNPVSQARVEPVVGADSQDATLLGESDLEDLVGRIALYPDDLLAIVLPASTYPLQIVEAARFLDALEKDSSLKPDDKWDDSVVALTNYPEVLRMMNEDLDWTWKLGEAVVAQQTDVIKAIEAFRDRAYAAGNLKSDDFQKVTEDPGGVIEITPVQEDVIYVPYYEPERVVVYQPRPVYYYYPRPYPLYYYPYPADYVFAYDYFWGVTTAFTIGWYAHDLNVFHYSYYGHPYYGHPYWNHWWYRRPNIAVYNNYYVNNYHRHPRNSFDRSHYGDHWTPHGNTRLRYSDQRITRTRYYPSPNSVGGGGAMTVARNAHNNQPARNTNEYRDQARPSHGSSTDTGIHFRPRTGTANPAGAQTRTQTAHPGTRPREPVTVRRSPPAATPNYGSRSTPQLRQSFAPSTGNRSSFAPETRSRSSFAPETRSRSTFAPSTVRPSTSRPPQVHQPSRAEPSRSSAHTPSAHAPSRSASGNSRSSNSGAHVSRSRSSDRRR